MDVSPDSIIITDLKSKILQANKQAAYLHGLKDPSEIVGKDTIDPIVEEERTKLIEQIGIAFTKVSVSNCQFNILRKDSQRFPVEVNAAIILEKKP